MRAVRAFIRAFVASMVCKVMIVRVRTDVDADLSHWIPKERVRALLDTITGCIFSESIMTEYSLRGVGTAADALLDLIAGVGSIRAEGDTGIVEGLSE